MVYPKVEFMILEKQEYWDKLIDYYYDHVHWGDDPPGGIYSWLEKEYSIVSGTGMDLEFTDPKKLTFFVLKWS